MQQVDQVKERHVPLKMGEVNFSEAEEVLLETTRARFTNLHKRQEDLVVQLLRDSARQVC
ncbi:hypothetical protein ACS0TY_030797 [Phlomoides rotata]